MPIFKSLVEGWPRPGTSARDWLDQIYWGAEPLGESFETTQPSDSYYMPRIIQATGSQIATWRSAGDILPDRMGQFVHWWADWRRRRGQSVEARRRNHQGKVRVKLSDTRIPLPMPTPIARWEGRRGGGGVPHESDWDHRNSRP